MMQLYNYCKYNLPTTSSSEMLNKQSSLWAEIDSKILVKELLMGLEVCFPNRSGIVLQFPRLQVALQRSLLCHLDFDVRMFSPSDPSSHLQNVEKTQTQSLPSKISPSQDLKTPSSDTFWGWHHLPGRPAAPPVVPSAASTTDSCTRTEGLRCCARARAFSLGAGWCSW